MSGPDTGGDWARRLERESDRWVREGLITSEQQDSIVRLYPRGDISPRDRTVTLFTLLGSVLVGVGVILFFAANWQALHAAVKLGAIILAIVLAYASGWYLEYERGDFPRLGHSLIFLGGLLFGAGVWLVAQIFHLDTDFPAGFLLWSIGLLPMAFATASSIVLYLSTALLVIWTIAEQTSTISYNPIYPVLAILVVIPLARSLRANLAEAGALFGLLAWYLAGLLPHLPEQWSHAQPAFMGGFALLFGAALFSLGLSRVGDERSYVALGSMLALGGAFMHTFRWATGIAAPAIPALASGSYFQLGGVVATLTALFVASKTVLQAQDKIRKLALIAPALAAVLALSTFLMAPITRMIIHNLFVFTGIVGMIAMGIRLKSQLVVNLGLFGFIVFVLTRYFDLFFSAMNRSLFFVLGGIILLAGGYLLERNRRRWMADWGGGHGEA